MLVRWTIVGLLTLLAPESVSAATVGFRRIEIGWVSRSGFAIVGPGFEIAGNNGSLGGFCGFPNSWMASACRINAEMASGQMTCMALEFSTGFRSISIRHRRLFINIFNSTMM